MHILFHLFDSNGTREENRYFALVNVDADLQNTLGRWRRHLYALLQSERAGLEFVIADNIRFKTFYELPDILMPFRDLVAQSSGWIALPETAGAAGADAFTSAYQQSSEQHTELRVNPLGFCWWDISYLNRRTAVVPFDSFPELFPGEEK